jgi:hypothetical protein
MDTKDKEYARDFLDYVRKVSEVQKISPELKAVLTAPVVQEAMKFMYYRGQRRELQRASGVDLNLP